jgi:hypothetical protein
MSEEKYVNAEWVCVKPGRYHHKWKNMPYYAQCGVRWRNQVFQIRITDERTSGGWQITFEIAYQGSVNRSGAGFSKGMGGSFGHCRKDITEGNYRLEFYPGKGALSFEEKAIEPEKTEEGNAGIVNFFTLESDNWFKKLEPKPEPWIQKNTTEIELYNFRDANVASDVVAQFDKDRLVLNTWRLGSGEDEYYYIVPGDELRKLYAEFQLQEHQKAELLVGLHNAFAGKDCIEKFTKYLDYKKIKYSHQFCL